MSECCIDKVGGECCQSGEECDCGSVSVRDFVMEISAFKENYKKFIDKNNNAAGTRARKSLSNLSKLAKEIRKEIQEKKASS